MRAVKQWQHLAVVLCALASLTLHPSVGEVLFHRRDHRDQGEYPGNSNIFSVRTYEDALEYLNKYGYLNCTVERQKRAVVDNVDELAQEGSVHKPHCSQDEVEEAFKRLQAKLNLKQTGLLDEDTRRTMSAGRCGDIDVKEPTEGALAEAIATHRMSTGAPPSDEGGTTIRTVPPEAADTEPPDLSSPATVAATTTFGHTSTSTGSTGSATTTSTTTAATTSTTTGAVTTSEGRRAAPPSLPPSPSPPSSASASPPAPPAGKPSAPAPPPSPSAPAPAPSSSPSTAPSRVRRRALGINAHEQTMDDVYWGRVERERAKRPLLQRLTESVNDSPTTYSVWRRNRMLEEMTEAREEAGTVFTEEERRLTHDIRESGGVIRRKRTIKAVEDASESSEESAAEAEGRRLRNAMVTWRILDNSMSGKIPVNEQMNKISLAFRMWSEVIPLTFKEMTENEVSKVDILIAFGKHWHLNCLKPFDGHGGELAHSCPGCIHFDEDENYKNTNQDSNGINLLMVAVHEIGHVLGLWHNNKKKSIMYPIYIYNTTEALGPDFELGWDDRKNVQEIYGVCKGEFDIVFDWLRRTKPAGDYEYKYLYNTYFTRGNRYWMYENNGNRTRYGDPLLIHIEWSGLQGPLDAYVQTLTQESARVYSIKTYFFKGDQYYRYDDGEDRVAQGYPRLISDDFGGPNCTETIPDNLDAAWQDARDGNLYFFKGEWVWLYRIADIGVSGACPVGKTLFTNNFPMMTGQGQKPLTGDVDTVYHSYYHVTTYFIKGEEVWENVGMGLRAGVNRLKYRGPWWRLWFDICDVE